ncbi:Ras association (RalGDS/AF-6) domain [Popillia japonica]|uniref:Diacylglycerol kinase n=1 Tax=Popillia japonica TaxID=7064 RepID=A0AAW1NKN4_POPJA
MADDAGGHRHGHSFSKKTFHKPTYCHHCSDMLWGLIQQGFICEICNFVVHDRCLKTVVSPCSSTAPSLIKNPVAHCWSETVHHKRKFCNVCRKRLDDSEAIHCEICEYYVHIECQDFAVPDCKENATYLPGKSLGLVHHEHHWREGNLPSNSKCALCKKTCWTSECLSGYRCEWCGITCHALCHINIPQECTFGILEPIYLPPHAVRKKLCPREASRMTSAAAITNGMRNNKRNEEYSQPHGSSRDREKQNKEKEDRDEEVIKVYDGNNSLRRGIFQTIVVARQSNLDHVLAQALKAFRITSSQELFHLTDLYSPNEARLQDPTPVLNLHRIEGKRPAVFLRFKDGENDSGSVKVYPGKLQVAQAFCTLPVDSNTTVADLIGMALKRFNCASYNTEDCRCSEVLLDGGVTERVLSWNERPWEIMKQLAKDSIRQMELMRFYLQLKQDPHGPNLALFVGNLPPNLSERNYENILTDLLGKENKFSKIGPIYYEYGSMVITYEDSEKAVRALYTLRESKFEDKHLLVMLLPNIEPSMVPAGVQPLLVFVNVKSGGCQGLELISSFRKLLNPYQVFDLDNGGPLPGLYVFRNIQNYKILVCGGDGTIGWVLQCLDNVGQDSQCSSPACAIVPLGTGNDLARVLRWGTGYTGAEDPLNLLRDVIDAEEIRLDRWTVVFHPEDKADDSIKQVNSTVVAGSTSGDNSQIFVMNNYFGIGIDADLCLDFHNAREENPNKFNSRLHNKGVYVKMGLRKMVGPKMCKDLHKEVRLEVDGKLVELPQVEGIIILNILSWGSGANPWGPEKEDQFSKPNHWDGMLEVVGVTGVVHLGQIQSGLRSAMRIAQGGHIKIHLHSDIPVQVDGEPWVQSPCDVVVLKSALKATMLKKNKFKRRPTEPNIMPTNGEGGDDVEENEREDEEEKYRTVDASIAGHTVGAPAVERRGITDGSQQYNVLETKK